METENTQRDVEPIVGDVPDDRVEIDSRFYIGSLERSVTELTLENARLRAALEAIATTRFADR